MSYDQEDDTHKVQSHITKATWPRGHIVPWMTVKEKQELPVHVGLQVMEDLTMSLERAIEIERVWMDFFREHAEWLNNGEGEEPKPPADKKGNLITRVSPTAIIAAYSRSLRVAANDNAPSVGGLRSRQGVEVLRSQRRGVETEAPSRSLFEKLTGRGKEKPVGLE